MKYLKHFEEKTHIGNCPPLSDLWRMYALKKGQLEQFAEMIKKNLIDQKIHFLSYVAVTMYYQSHLSQYVGVKNSWRTYNPAKFKEGNVQRVYIDLKDDFSIGLIRVSFTNNPDRFYQISVSDPITIPNPTPELQEIIKAIEIEKKSKKFGM